MMILRVLLRAARILGWHRQRSRELDERIATAIQQVHEADDRLRRAEREAARARAMQALTSKRFSVLIPDPLVLHQNTGNVGGS